MNQRARLSATRDARRLAGVAVELLGRALVAAPITKDEADDLE